MDDIDALIFYDDDEDDDDNDFVGQNYLQDTEYEYEYEDMKRETLSELYEYCLRPSLYDAASYMLPFVVVTIIFRLFAQSQYISYKVFHIVSIILGIYIVQHYARECLYLLIVFVMLSYITLCMPEKYTKGIGVFLPSLLIIGYCEFSMQPVVWHKVRSLIMTMAMKAISIAADANGSNKLPDLYSYASYMFCAVTCLFGPWIPFKDYMILQHSSQNKWWIIVGFGYALLSFFFLSISNCWTQWIFMDNSWKWLIAYRDALSFRTSHYFISYIASGILLLGGFPFSLATIVKPLHIELPRSLVQVVIYWNIPMHFWLKTYIFRPSIKQLGKFGAVTITYMTSALLHGLNFQLASVLLSLGLYTYVEFQLRSMLASAFDACIASKRCTKDKCLHSYNSDNCWWVTTTNMMFSALAIFHLAYLGLMFDTSELQETGYSYVHTVEKWSELGFASHWVAFATYCIYFLIR